jgi:hypothetical protein
MAMTRMLIALLVPIAIVGCAPREPIRGWSPNPKPSAASAAIGQRYVDFKFVDSKGIERPIRREMGDYTVLALTRCDRSTHGPAVDLLRAIRDVNRNASNVKVVGVDIHWSPSGCKDHDQCHLVASEPNLGTICDATGAIHRAYGDQKESWFYVISPDKTIEFSAPATRGAQLSRELEAKVRQLSRERVEASFRYEN